jgi:threonine dehydrogenase-like Zn-dependent dehydrogenase
MTPSRVQGQAIGLVSVAGAKLRGAGLIFAVGAMQNRLKLAEYCGADVAADFKKTDPIKGILRLTEVQGFDPAIEALPAQATFEAYTRATRPGGAEDVVR